MKKSVKYGLYFVVGLVAVLLLASIVYFLLLFPAFLFTEIFAAGVKIKEEQDLTI